MDIPRFARQHLILVVPLLVLYLATQPSNYITGDGAAELTAAYTHVPFFRSNHLLVTPVYSGLIWLHNSMGLPFTDFITLQLFNIACMLASLVTLSFTLEIFRLSWLVRFSTVLIVGLCHGLWLHSITPETGIQAHLLFTLALYFQVRKAYSSTLRLDLVKLSAICFAGSVMFAFNYVILAPLVMLYSTKISVRNIRDAASSATTFCTTAGVCGGSAFLIAALYEGIRTPESFFDWLFTHGENQRLLHMSTVNALSILRSLSGFFALFFWPENILTQVKMLLKHASYANTEFPVGWMILACSALVYLVGLILRGLLVKTRINQALGAIGGFFLLFLFGVKWLGSDPQFWIPWGPLAFIPLGIGISKIKKFECALLASIIITMFSSNFSIESPSLLFPSGGPKFETARCVAQFIDTESSLPGSREHTTPVLYSPGGVETEFLQALLPRSEVISLVYDPRLSTQKDLLAYLIPKIRADLDSGRSVFFDGLQDAEDLQRVGMWEMFESLHGVSRAKMRNLLHLHFSPVHRTICSDRTLVTMYPPLPNRNRTEAADVGHAPAQHAN